MVQSALAWLPTRCIVCSATSSKLQQELDVVREQLEGALASNNELRGELDGALATNSKLHGADERLAELTKAVQQKDDDLHAHHAVAEQSRERISSLEAELSQYSAKALVAEDIVHAMKVYRCHHQSDTQLSHLHWCCSSNCLASVD